MRLATSQHLLWRQGLAAPPSLRIIRERGVRPTAGFARPLDVLKDPHLTRREKREILSSWASDASAVQDEPTQRWLLGTPEPAPLVEVLDALKRLDRRQAYDDAPLSSLAQKAREQSGSFRRAAQQGGR